MAISVKNHELTNKHNQSHMVGIVDEDLPLGFIPQSQVYNPKKTLPSHPNSNINTQLSQNKVSPSSSLKMKDGNRSPMKLNYDSTSRILMAADLDNPSMQIKKLTGKRRQYTP